MGDGDKSHLCKSMLSHLGRGGGRVAKVFGQLYSDGQLHSDGNSETRCCNSS